jgi:hypothetical protein
MTQLYLFIVACLLAGVGGAGGSILGNAFGEMGLWIGGFVGALLASILVGLIAKWRQWVPAEAVRTTTIGTALGALAAAGVAVNTLSSPVGPILGTSLAGLGAILGARASGHPRKPEAR